MSGVGHRCDIVWVPGPHDDRPTGTIRPGGIVESAVAPTDRSAIFVDVGRGDQ
jgi:hypothetical protein